MALHKAADEIARASNVDIKFDTRGTAHPLGEDEEIAAYRIGREAVMNAVKHADAHEVRIRLSYGQESTTLVVSDDGHGFSVNEANATEHAHYGLAGMQERALGIGATLDIHSDAQRGTRVCLRIPTADTPLSVSPPAV